VRHDVANVGVLIDCCVYLCMTDLVEKRKSPSKKQQTPKKTKTSPAGGGCFCYCVFCLFVCLSVTLFPC